MFSNQHNGERGTAASGPLPIERLGVHQTSVCIQVKVAAGAVVLGRAGVALQMAWDGGGQGRKLNLKPRPHRTRLRSVHHPSTPQRSQVRMKLRFRDAIPRVVAAKLFYHRDLARGSWHIPHNAWIADRLNTGVVKLPKSKWVA